jgi:hypothetical protein
VAIGWRKAVGHDRLHHGATAQRIAGRAHEGALVSLWTRYAGAPPASTRTDVRGNVVTCVLVDAVADYDRSMVTPQTRDTVRGVGKLTAAAYKRDAVAAVVRLTRQRVASFASSHDRATDLATEVFTLEPSLSRGAPRAERRFRHAFWPPPPPHAPRPHAPRAPART